MPEAGTGGDVETRLNELKNAVYYLSELVQRSSGATGADRLTELSTRVDKLSDSLAWVARQSGELSSVLKAVEAKLNNLPAREDVTGIAKRLEGLPSPEQTQAISTRVDKLADAMGWVARQGSEFSTSMNALNQKLDGVPTREQFSQMVRAVTTSTESSSAEVVSRVDVLSESLAALGKQNLLMIQILETLTKRAGEISTKLDALPNRDQMGQFSTMLGNRLDQMEQSLGRSVIERMNQAAKDNETTLTSMAQSLKSLDIHLANINPASSTQLLDDLQKHFDAQRKQGEALAEALTVLHNDLNKQNERLNTIGQKTDALGEALSAAGGHPQAMGGPSEAGAVSSMGSITPAQLEQLSARLNEISPKLDSVSMGDATAHASLSTKVDTLITKLDQQTESLQQAMIKLSERLDQLEGEISALRSFSPGPTRPVTPPPTA